MTLMDPCGATELIFEQSLKPFPIYINGHPINFPENQTLGKYLFKENIMT